MKAAVIERQGGTENISYRDYPDPVPRTGDVLLRVHAAGLNHLDIFVRKGMPGWPVSMPFISGGDISGEIVTLGPQVQGWSIGERVIVHPEQPDGMMGEVIDGGMCEYCRVPADYLIRLDDRLSHIQGASIPVNYGTAYRMLLANGDVQVGDLILVLGASGGVGNATVQVAKALGCIVIACASTEAKCDRLKKVGVDHVINYAKQDFSREAWRISGKKGVDLCVNFTGGDTFAPSLRALRHHGKLLTCGATAGFDPKIDIRYIWQRELRIIGSNSYGLEDIRRGMLDVASGRCSLPQITTFPLSRLGDAETLMELRDFFGKIVLVPDALLAREEGAPTSAAKTA